MDARRPALEALEAGTLEWRPRSLPLEDWGELLRRLRPVGLGIAAATCTRLAYRFNKDRWWRVDKDGRWLDEPAELRRWLHDLVERQPLSEVDGTFGRLCPRLKLPLWSPTRIWQADVPLAVEELLEAIYALECACTSGDRGVVEEAACALEQTCWRWEWHDRFEASRPETPAAWRTAESPLPPRRRGRPLLEHVRPAVAEVATWSRERQGGQVPWSHLARGLCALGCGLPPVGKLAEKLAEGDRRWRAREARAVAVKKIGPRK
jgi:hypothetical protein